jgi:hypothetical protein
MMKLSIVLTKTPQTRALKPFFRLRLELVPGAFANPPLRPAASVPRGMATCLIFTL